MHCICERMCQYVQVYALMEKGAAARATGATKLNEISSRSHAIFMLIVEKSVMGGVGVGGPGGGDGMEQFQGIMPGRGAACCGHCRVCGFWCFLEDVVPSARALRFKPRCARWFVVLLEGIMSGDPRRVVSCWCRLAFKAGLGLLARGYRSDCALGSTRSCSGCASCARHRSDSCCVQHCLWPTNSTWISKSVANSAAMNKGWHPFSRTMPEFRTSWFPNQVCWRKQHGPSKKHCYVAYICCANQPASTGAVSTFFVQHAGMGKANGISGSMEVQQSVRVGKLNLVDLAGSERVHVTGT
jgi:hypothetical protein